MGGGGEGSVDDATQSDSGDGVKVKVKCSNGSNFSVQIGFESTVGSFKEVLSPKCDIPANQQRQIYKSRILKDDQTLQSYGLFNNMGLDTLMNMFGGLSTGSLAVPNWPDVPPEELYSAQLSQLQEMGFFDRQENIRALMATAENVHAAVERLLGNLGR